MILGIVAQAVRAAIAPPSVGAQLAVGMTGSPYFARYNLGDWSAVANPADPPTGTVRGIAFNGDGTLLLVAHEGSPYLAIYNTADDSRVVTPTTLPAGNGRAAAFSPDGALAAIAHLTSPFITVYTVSGWVKRPDPSVLPAGLGLGVAFNHDGTRLAVAHASSPYVTVYNTGTWAKLANPATLPAGTGRSAAYNIDGSRLAIGHDSSPFVSIYNMATFTKLANPATLPAGACNGAAFSPDGSLLAVAHDNSPYVTIYNTSTWSKLATPAVLPAGTGRSVAFSPDGSLLAVAHDDSPYVTIYNTGTWSKLANPAALPTSTGVSVGFKGAAGLARPVFVAAENSVTTSAAFTASLPAGWSAGQLAILHVSSITATLPTPPGWNLVGSHLSSGGGGVVTSALFWRILQEGDSGPSIQAGTNRAAAIWTFAAGTFNASNPVVQIATGAGDGLGFTPVVGTASPVAVGQHYQMQFLAAGGNFNTVLGYPYAAAQQTRGIGSAPSFSCSSGCGVSFGGGVSSPNGFSLSASTNWVTRKIAIIGKGYSP
ncbi:hypothetical protein FQZ97_469530 [compost metagenome]